MDEQKDTSMKKEEIPKEVPPQTPPSVDPRQTAPNPNPEEDKHDNKPKKSSTISDKVMVFATCVIAVGTLVSAAAIILQWREMVKGGADTSALVGYAQRQADNADKIKESAYKQASASQQFADTAALINGGIGDAVKKLDVQAKATQKFAQIAKDSLYLEQRPWVGIQVIPVQTNPNLIASDNTVSSVQIVAINTGRTPALMFHNECCESPSLDSEDNIPDYDSLQAQESAEDNTRRAEWLRRAIESDPLHADQIRASDKAFWERRNLLVAEIKGRWVRMQVIPPNVITPLEMNSYSGPDDRKYHFIIGKFVYRDPIDPTKEHTTKYCLVAHGSSPLRLCRTGQDEN